MVKLKEKSKCLSLSEKAKIIEVVSKGLSVTLLLKKYGFFSEAEYTAADIEEWNKGTNLGESENENESDESDCKIQEQPSIKLKHGEAVCVAIEWAKQNTLNITEIASLKHTQEKAVLANLSAIQRQSKITSHLSTND